MAPVSRLPRRERISGFPTTARVRAQKAAAQVRGSETPMSDGGEWQPWRTCGKRLQLQAKNGPAVSMHRRQRPEQSLPLEIAVASDWRVILTMDHPHGDV